MAAGPHAYESRVETQLAKVPMPLAWCSQQGDGSPRLGGGRPRPPGLARQIGSSAVAVGPAAALARVHLQQPRAGAHEVAH